MFMKYLFFIICIPLVALAVFFIWHKDSKRSRYLGYVFVSTALWDFCEGLSVTLSNPNLKIFFHGFKYVGITMLPVFTLMFVLVFLNRDSKLIQRHVYLFIIPMITLLMIATDSRLHYFQTAVWIKEINSYSLVLSSKSWGFYLHMSYSYLLFIISFLLIASKWLNTPRVYRKQLNFILVGLFFPMIGNVLYFLLGNSTKTMDPTPFLFSITAITTFYCSYYFEFMNLIPIAREYIFKAIPSPVIVVNASNRIIDLNDSAENLLRTTLTHATGKNIGDINPSFSNDGPDKVRIESNVYCINRLPITDCDKNIIGTAITLYDITTQEDYLNQLEYMSFHDSLTGLYNRNFYNKLCEDFDTAANMPLGIIFGDMNGLKKTNDTYGHFNGDEALRVTADALRTVTPAKGYAMRLGGDEFCVFLPNTSEEEISTLIDDVHSYIEENKRFNCISISIGHAIKKSPEESLKQLITKADNMMYSQKENYRH